MSAKEMPIEDVVEVMDYLDAKTELESFVERNKKVMQEYAALCEQYNTHLESADKKVRELNVSCGPFKQLSPQVKVDGEKLVNLIGREEFIKAGGKVATKTTYEMDKKTFEAAVAKNSIPSEVIDVVRTSTPKFSVIPKAVIP